MDKFELGEVVDFTNLRRISIAPSPRELPNASEAEGVFLLILLLPQSFCFAKCQPPLRWGGSCSFQLCIIPTNSDLFNIKKIKKLLFSGAFLSDFLNRSFNYFQITFYVSFARACAYKYAVALFKNKAFVFAFNFAMTVGYYY